MGWRSHSISFWWTWFSNLESQIWWSWLLKECKNNTIVGIIIITNNKKPTLCFLYLINFTLYFYLLNTINISHLKRFCKLKYSTGINLTYLCFFQFKSELPNNLFYFVYGTISFKFTEANFGWKTIGIICHFYYLNINRIFI